MSDLADDYATQLQDAYNAVSRKIAIVNDAATPLDTLIELAHDANPNVRAWVAMNPRTPADVIERLLDDGANWLDKDHIREYAAMNPALPPHLQRGLAQTHPNEILQNPNIHPNTLTWFIEGPCYFGSRINRDYVLAEALAHPKTPFDVVLRFRETFDPTYAGWEEPQAITDAIHEAIERQGIVGLLNLD